ncbi:hypothetical protein NUSPORA_00912 [Nucleospora cyclopteri]
MAESYKITKSSDLQGLNNSEIVKFISNSDLSDEAYVDLLKKCIEEINTKNKTVIGFYEQKLEEEKKLNIILLKRLWNVSIENKNKEIAEIFKEIENDIKNI